MAMRSTGRALVGFVVIALLVGIGGTAQATQKFGPIQLSGNLQSQNLIRHGDIDKYQFIQQRNSMRLRFEWDWIKRGGKFLDRYEVPWVETSSLFLLYRGVYDSAFTLVPGVKTKREFTGVPTDPRHDDLDDLNNDQLDALEFENVLREAYVDIKFKGSLSVRAGRQQVIWGESDGFRLLDRVNSLDISYHQIQEGLPPPAFGFEEFRIPSWMLKGLYDVGSLGSWSNVFVEAYWNPGDWRPTKVSFLPHPWGIRIGEPLTNRRDGAFFAVQPNANRLNHGTDLFGQGNYDRNPIDNSQFGIRINGVTGRDTPILPAGMQLQIGYLYQRFQPTGGVTTSAAPARGIKPTPEGQVETDRLIVANTLPVEYYVPYIHTIGIAANYFEEYSGLVLRSEMAYDFGIPFFVCNRSSTAANGIGNPGGVPSCQRETTFAPFLPGIINHDVWSGLIAFDRPTWIRPLNKKTTFFITGQFFWNYLIQKSKNLTGALDLPTRTRLPGDLDDEGRPQNYRDDIHRWEMLFTLAILGFYRGGSLNPALVYILDPVNSYSQEVAIGVDWFMTPNFAINIAQRYLINPKKEVNFEPWLLGGLNAGRSETGIRLTYQF